VCGGSCLRFRVRGVDLVFRGSRSGFGVSCSGWQHSRATPPNEGHHRVTLTQFFSSFLLTLEPRVE